MAVSPTSVYWMSASGLYGCPLAGCGAAPSGPYGTASFTFSTDQNVVYFDNGGSPLLVATGSTPTDTEIFRMKTDGSAIATITSTQVGAWTLDGGLLYWFSGGIVQRRPLSTGVIAVIMSGLTNGTSIATDANNIYLATTVEVLACPKATGQCGSNLVTIASSNSPILLATEPDSAFVYYSNSKGIFRCPYTGCTDPNNVPPWAGGQQSITALASDATGIYWTDTTRGAVMKCAHGPTCTTPTTIAAGLDHPYGVAVDAQWVYWTLSQGATAVQRAPK
jgi:hypothetical protein